MKNKNLLVLLAAGLSLSVISCEKEETIKETEMPTVQLTVSGNPAKLFNEVKLSATATDNEAVSRIVYYLNNDSVGVATEKPFEVKWNTKAVADGKYMLKAVAYDLNNNKGEAAQEVNIKNTLLKVFIDEGYIASRNNEYQQAYEEWLFLSDKEGNTVGAPKQVTNETMLSWERPNDFNSDTIYLNKVYHSTYINNYEGAKNSKYFNLNSYPNFSLEEMNLKAYTNTGNEIVGSAGITVNNNFAGDKYYDYRTSVPNHYSSRNDIYNSVSYDVSLYKEKAKGFSTYGYSNADDHSREKYFRLDELTAGNDYTFHVDEYEPMNAQRIKLPTNFNYYYIDITGYLEGDAQTGYGLDSYSQWNSDNAPAQIDLFYADKIFPTIRTYIGGRIGNKSFYISKNSKLSETFTLPNLTLNLNNEISTKNVVVSTNGNVDMGGVSFVNRTETETDYIYTYKFLYLPNEAGNYHFPKIPTTILDIYPVFENEFTYSYTYLHDNSGLNSYDELLQYWFTNKFQGQNLNETSTLYLYPELEGGRVQTKPGNYKEEMKREELRSRGIWY